MARIMKKKRIVRRLIFRKKICLFCTEKAHDIDYKDIPKLSRFTTERGKIIPRRVSGVCAKHQRMLARAIKQARFVAFIPFVRK